MPAQALLQNVGAMPVRVSCTQCSLKDICMPSSLSPADIERLDQLIRHNRKVRRGEHLFRAPDALKSLYAIRSGFFKTYVLHEDGREQVTGFSMMQVKSYIQNGKRNLKILIEKKLKDEMNT